MNSIQNLLGTIQNVFRIGKRSTTIYTGNYDPNLSSPTPMGSFSIGDIYLKINDVDNVQYSYTGTFWKSLTSPEIKPETSNVTVSVQKNQKIPVDCTGGNVVINPPSNPRRGDKFSIIDSRGGCEYNTITINTTIQKLNGASDDLVINRPFVTVNFEYVDTVVGWTYG